MATYNGHEWIAEQVNSILTQRGVKTRLIISDDGSTDGTREYLQALSQRDPRVTLLPQRPAPANTEGLPQASGAAGNFFWLLRHAEIAPEEYVALSDQDDIWLPHKLSHQVEVLREENAIATSSSVRGFDAFGNEFLIRKDYPQRRWDFVFEAPGPGCSFLLTPAGFAFIRAGLEHQADAGAQVHDWWLYAFVRGSGLKWHIDSVPGVLYRQHAGNAVGANRGWKAKQQRLERLRSGWYRQQFIVMGKSALLANQIGKEFGSGALCQNCNPAALERLIQLLEKPTFANRWKVACHAPALRRRRRDGFALAILGLIGRW